MRLPFINSRTIVFILLLTFISLLWLGANPRVRAQAKRLPKRSGHVNDFGEVLDAATKQRLEKVLENLKQKAGVDFVIATVKTAGAEDLYDYSLRFANEWNVGAPASPNKSVLLFIAVDNAKFFTQVSKTARADLPDGVIGDMGQRIRQKIDTAGFSGGLVIGIQTFVNAVGERNNFTFEALDRQGGENPDRRATATTNSDQPGAPTDRSAGSQAHGNTNAGSGRNAHAFGRRVTSTDCASRGFVDTAGAAFRHTVDCCDADAGRITAGD